MEWQKVTTTPLLRRLSHHPYPSSQEEGSGCAVIHEKCDGRR